MGRRQIKEAVITLLFRADLKKIHFAPAEFLPHAHLIVEGIGRIIIFRFLSQLKQNSARNGNVVPIFSKG